MVRDRRRWYTAAPMSASSGSNRSAITLFASPSTICTTPEFILGTTSTSSASSGRNVGASISTPWPRTDSAGTPDGSGLRPGIIASEDRGLQQTSGACIRISAEPMILNVCEMGNPMPTAGIDDPILKRFRAALDELYGDRLERVVLFGSRARGDARADSDYDIAIFLN